MPPGELPRTHLRVAVEHNESRVDSQHGQARAHVRPGGGVDVASDGRRKMRGKKRWRIGIALAVVAILAIGVGVALAANSSSGGAITAVKVKREVDAASTNSTTFVNVPGASMTIGVPSGQRALLLIRFSAESSCQGGNFGDWCSLRIVVDGVQAHPRAGLNFAFDTDAGVATNHDIWEGHSMDRSITVGSGSHTVRVQWAVTNAATSFRLDDWSLTVERSKK
jgi:hypothetical protein